MGKMSTTWKPNRVYTRSALQKHYVDAWQGSVIDLNWLQQLEDPMHIDQLHIL